MWSYLFFMFRLTAIESGQNISFEKNSKLLPQYTELDDYNNCMSEKDGLYCFGTFRIHPNTNEPETYIFIKEYSAETFNYDRTIIHRGVCVSSRCQSHPNTTQRFEMCVQERTSKSGLNTTLDKLHSCGKKQIEEVLDSSCKIFLAVIFLILLMNVVGTVYELTNSRNGSECKFWISWSIRSNWKELVGPVGTEPDMTALAPIQVMRVVIMAVVIMTHIFYISGTMYLHNPDFYEKVFNSPLKVVYLKNTSVVQVAIVLSSFLSTYNILRSSKNQQIGLWMLPKRFLKRYFRIAPVHLLFVFFAATIWPLVSEGPTWPLKIDAQSAICRRKSWAHILHINNIIEPSELCLPQTWSIAADMQLQLVILIVTLSLIQYNLPKWKILITLLVTSCMLNAGVAYLKNIKPLIHAMNSKHIPDLLHDHLSYAIYYYMATWGSLPACVIGMLLAHVYFTCRQKGFLVHKVKWLRLLCRYSLPMLMVWVATGCVIKDVQSSHLLYLYLGVERSVYCLFPCLWLLGMISGVRIYPGFEKLNWWVWTALGRLSLPVLMVHFMILETYFSAHHQPVVLSWGIVMMIFVATWCLSYLLAVPITLLVELPFINTINYIYSLDLKLFTESKSVTKELIQKVD